MLRGSFYFVLFLPKHSEQNLCAKNTWAIIVAWIMFTQKECWCAILNTLPNFLQSFRFSDELRKMWCKLQYFLFPTGLETVASNPGMPVKCLTSNLLQSRRRLATSSASSQSHTFMSSVESECHSSPTWERDCQVRVPLIWTQASFVWPIDDRDTFSCKFCKEMKLLHEQQSR